MNVYGFLVAYIVLYREVEPTSPSHYNIGDVKSINFVEVIKKDLKSGNDDYKELRTDSKLPPTIKLTDIITAKNVPLFSEKNIMETKEDVKRFRRVNHKYSSEYDYTDIPSINDKVVKHNKTNANANTNDATAPRKPIKIFNLNRITLPTHRPSSTVKDGLKKSKQISDIPKFVNKNKVDKFKQFMEKNKGLLKQYMSSKFEVRTETYQVKVSKPELMRIKPLLRREVKKKEKQRDGYDEMPGPEMLDMSPARGGRVHKQRMKGRLCHRHVLMPEGPKYDSEGKWYLKEHPATAERPYEKTRRPKLLLPRCCNCCKKSVLGCE